MEGKEPKIAFIAILNKKNSPILLRNYIGEHLQKQDTFTQEELASFDLQLKMLAYQSLDLFDEKQRLKGVNRVQPSQPGSQQAESAYMGLILETFISHYMVDLYGQISNTNYKYVIIKNETKTNQMGQKPSDDHIRNMFKSVIRAHTDLLLNPFFEPLERPEDENECYEEIDTQRVSGNSKFMELFRKKVDDIASYFDKQL